jgi:glucose/arabinose dehydrogenase
VPASLRPLALGAAFLVLAGCSGGSGTPSTTAPAPATTTSASTTTDASEPATLDLEEFATGFDQPVDAVSAPGDPDRVYVVEQPGRIMVAEDGQVRDRPFLDIRDRVSCCGERGLLSVAFHPDYAENGRFYVDYTNLDGDTRVVEFRANPGDAVPHAGSPKELLAVEQPFSNHNGGQLVFGPDGLLYVGMGDGGGAGDPEENGQDLDSRLGKLLTLDVDERGADWQVAAYGLRNPWRFTFDAANGDLYIGDVGQGSIEEIDALAWPSAELPNFGWNLFEGSQRYATGEPNPEGRLVAPVAEYTHADGCSVTGGYVYRGTAIAGLAGRYFYGDYCSGIVWSFRLRGGKATGERREPFTVDQLTSFGLDPDGELLLVSGAGTVYRLVAR